MNLEKHRKTSYVRPQNLYRHVNTPLLERNRQLNTEFTTDVHEVVTKKKKIDDSIPIHISLYVYQLSKLWLYKFIFTLDEFLISGSFRISYIGNYLRVHQNPVFLC
jgi:hypothetical protein